MPGRPIQRVPGTSLRSAAPRPAPSRTDVAHAKARKRLDWCEQVTAVDRVHFAIASRDSALDMFCPPAQSAGRRAEAPLSDRQGKSPQSRQHWAKARVWPGDIRVRTGTHPIRREARVVVQDAAEELGVVGHDDHRPDHYERNKHPAGLRYPDATSATAAASPNTVAATRYSERSRSAAAGRATRRGMSGDPDGKEEGQQRCQQAVVVTTGARQHRSRRKTDATPCKGVQIPTNHASPRPHA